MAGFQRIYNDYFYFKKDHFCPDCKEKLEKVTVSKTVNHKSPEAKDFDFGSGKHKMRGDVTFTWDEFECPSCKKRFTVDEIKETEGIKPDNNINPFTVTFIVLLAIFILRLVKKLF